jgi:hypothetical protein
LKPQVNPLGAVEALVARFVAWARRVGETRVAWAVLALAFALATALILAWGGGQTFIQDEWTYLVVRRGWSLETLFAPQNGHLIVLPLMLYKTLFAVFGAESHLPYQATTVVLHLTIATLFFLLVRKRLPLAVAVALTVLLALFGVTWDTLMSAYEIPNQLGMAGGVGMLLALDRRTRGGDLAACALLAVSLASFSVGIAFALGALVSIWLGGRGQWRRAWIVLVPALLYAAWFVWARKFDQTNVSAEAISALLSGSADQLAAICAAITGLFRIPGSVGLPTVLGLRSDWGYPLALILVGLVVLHVRRAPRSIYFWTVVATLLFYLALVSAGLDPARTPDAGRYVYMGGIITLLLVAELAGEIRWSTVTGLVAAALFGLTLMANAAELRPAGRFFEAEAETNRATLAALELSRDEVDPDLFAEDETTAHSHPDMFFPAWAYFDAASDFGSPAFSVEELRASGEQAREAADQELVRALELTTEPGTVRARLNGEGPEPLNASDGRFQRRGACLVLLPDRGRSGAFRIQVPPGGFAFRTGPTTDVELKLARFGDAYVTELPATIGSATVAIPTDASAVPWRAELRSGERVFACPY